MDELNAGPPGPFGPPELEGDPRARPRVSRGKGTWMAAALVLALVAGGTLFASRLRPASPPADPQTGSAAVAAPSSPPGPHGGAPTDSIIRPEDLPGFETKDLTPSQRLWLYHRAHLEKCSCGCGYTVAECRVEDLTCPKSPGRAKELVAEAKRRRP